MDYEARGYWLERWKTLINEACGAARSNDKAKVSELYDKAEHARLEYKKRC